MAEIFETVMIVLFGASWPLNVRKSYLARSTKGKSLTFLILIFIGYGSGIVSKLINDNYMANISTKWYVLALYTLNFIMVGTDLFLYFRNKRIEKAENKAEEK